MKVCVFDGEPFCTVCGAPMLNRRQLCGTFKEDSSSAPHQQIGSGPGTELKALLAGWPFHITASPDCSCNRVADEMDAWGPDECERPERLAYVLAAMRENAARRGLPFVEVAARLLVRRAIRNARRNLPRIGPSGQS